MKVEALEAAGVPAGVVNLVQGGRETGAALIEQEIDGLLFTGSAAAGSHFRRVFADRPDVILALELGGNNPLVVWDATDPEAALKYVSSLENPITRANAQLAMISSIAEKDTITALTMLEELPNGTIRASIKSHLLTPKN